MQGRYYEGIHKRTTPAYTHDATQCRDCRYWKPLSGSLNGSKACHFMLDIGARREIGEDGICINKSKKKVT